MVEATDTNRFLTAEQVAKVLSLAPYAIRRMARQRLLPATRVGRRWRFSSAAIQEWSSKGGATQPAMWLRRNTDLEIGNWRFDSRRFVITHQADPGGDIDVEEMTTSAQTLDWIFHPEPARSGSRGESVGDLVELLRQTVDPQATLCSCGRERGPRNRRTDVPGVLFVEKRTKRSEIANYQTLCADAHVIPVVVTHSGPDNMKIAVDLKVVHRLLRPEGLERVRTFLLEQLGEGEWQEGSGWNPSLFWLNDIPDGEGARNRGGPA